MIVKHFIKGFLLVSCCCYAACNATTHNTEKLRTAPEVEEISGSPTKLQLNYLAELEQLSPIEIVNPNGKTAFEKYGIEFSGNCYDCDLAYINFSKTYVELVNVCNNKDTYRIEGFSYTASGTEFILKGKKTIFTFKKIDEAPIYELSMKGEKISLETKRLSKLYTKKDKLKKFAIHDCGGFDG